MTLLNWDARLLSFAPRQSRVRRGKRWPPRRVVIPTSVVEYGPVGGRYNLFGRGNGGRVGGRGA